LTRKYHPDKLTDTRTNAEGEAFFKEIAKTRDILVSKAAGAICNAD
jgi:hypothetical protein